MENNIIKLCSLYIRLKTDCDKINRIFQWDYDNYEYLDDIILDLIWFKEDNTNSAYDENWELKKWLTKKDIFCRTEIHETMWEVTNNWGSWEDLYKTLILQKKG